MTPCVARRVLTGVLLLSAARPAVLVGMRPTIRQQGFRADLAMPAKRVEELVGLGPLQVHGTRQFGVGRSWHRPYLLSGLIMCGGCEKRYQAQRRDRGAASYVCGGAVASGAGFCPSPRIAVSYLDDAVLDGIQKRLDRLLDPAEVRRRLELAIRRDEHNTKTASLSSRHVSGTPSAGS